MGAVPVGRPHRSFWSSSVSGANIISVRSALFSITANPSAATSATLKPTAFSTPLKVGGSPS